MGCSATAGTIVPIWSLINDHDDHVDGVRLRLRNAATNGPIVHPPGNI
jgi:hypothetical protein